ncbi:MAG: hypothetical protein WC355_02030 [Candidatus Omnitrophota bacterium]|jgi:hypothetical protein
MKRKAQATLEFTLIFVIIAVLIFGLLTFWKWSSDNIVKRQVRYNQTRVQAGSTTPGEPGGSGLFEASPIEDDQLYMLR